MARSISKYEHLKNRIYTIIYKSDTVTGRLFDLILLGIIVISVIIIMLETVEGFSLKYHSTLIIIEWVITILFTFEYILRILCISRPWRYVFSFYGIIDLMAILPMFLSIIFPATTISTYNCNRR